MPWCRENDDFLRTISGLIRPSKGTILFEGKPIQKEAPQKSFANDYPQVPEGRHVFPGLSVQENLEMGVFAKRQSSQRGLSAVFTKFPVLKERLSQDASNVYQEENSRCWQWGRALMSKPRLLFTR